MKTLVQIKTLMVELMETRLKVLTESDDLIKADLVWFDVYHSKLIDEKCTDHWERAGIIHHIANNNNVRSAHVWKIYQTVEDLKKEHDNV